MKQLLTGICFLGLAACTSFDGHVPKEEWTDRIAAAPGVQIPQDLAGVIFYRSPDAVAGKTVNIYVNNEYLASLQPGAYQQAAVCADNQLIHAEFAGADNAYARKHSVGSPYNLAANETVYFEVVPDATYGVAVRPVDAATGQQAVTGLERQNHTLPRLDRNRPCGQQVIKQYTLQASALFHFDKYDYANMLPQGKAEIQAIAQDMQNYMDQVGSIEVVGHTDPEGSDSYNMTLSHNRAQTVKQALEADGVNSALIQTRGLGETQLVVTDCEARHPRDRAARQSCNQPNRRVEITLYGNR